MHDTYGLLTEAVGNIADSVVNATFYESRTNEFDSVMSPDRSIPTHKCRVNTMRYSKKIIGEELIKELDKGYSIERISTWACNLLVSIRNNSIELDNILDRISLMDAGPEFEYTEQELRLLAALLIKEEKDPIKQIDDIKFKDII